MTETPVAVVRTSWWRRLLAKVFAQDIQAFCAECGTRLYGDGDRRDEHVECFWCGVEEALAKDSITEEAAMLELERLHDDVRARYVRPIPTELPGDGERVSH